MEEGYNNSQLRFTFIKRLSLLRRKEILKGGDQN